MEVLFDEIGTAYERTSVVLSTNLPFENWTEVLGVERLTGAPLDRISHRCHIARYTHDEARQFAKIVTQLVYAELPSSTRRR